SKCRCGPDDEPDVPTYPMTWPSGTVWPTVTDGRRTMWQYRGTQPPACWISASQPQPLRLRLPSTSQLFVDTLHTTRITRPAATAWMGVLRAAPRSTPSCDGRRSEERRVG